MNRNVKLVSSEGTLVSYCVAVEPDGGTLPDILMVGSKFFTWVTDIDSDLYEDNVEPDPMNTDNTIPIYIEATLGSSLTSLGDINGPKLTPDPEPEKE